MKFHINLSKPITKNYKIMKKKSFIYIPMMLVTHLIYAQNFQVTTNTFDLEKINRHKDWRIYSGFLDKNGNYVIKLGKPSCNVSASSGGSIGSVKYTYYGIAYDFEELQFDPSLNYVSKTEKHFPTTIATLTYEPVLGRKFFPFNHQNLIKRPLTPEYIGRRTIVPVIELTGFKIGLYGVIGKAVAPGQNFLGGVNYYSCGEKLWFEQISDKKTKENKGERWYPVTYYPIPGGGVIIYSTSGVLPETDKAVYIAKKYDENLNEIARVELPFDFKCVVHILPIEKKDSIGDFAVIAQSDDGKYTLGKKVVEPTKGELLILDGNTLQIKNRSTFKLEFTRWYPENVVVNDKGNIFIYGTCSNGSKEYAGKQGILPINKGQLSNPNLENMPDDQPNFQLMMTDPSGNVKYVKGINSKDAVAVSKIIGGIEKKAKNNVILNTYDFNKDYFFTDKYLILAGQQFLGRGKSGADKGNLFLAFFDLSNGNLVHYFIKPEDTYATYDVIFNKDRSVLYWATYDLETLNKLLDEQGNIEAKKIKSMIAGCLHLAKINISSGQASDFEWLGKDQWAVNYDAPVVVKDDASDVIVFQGRTLSKKAKDSELVLIKVKK